jgi:hypothetical protein
MPLTDKLMELESLETTPQKVKKIQNKSLYSQTTKNGVNNFEYKGELIKTHLPNNPDIIQFILDRNSMLDLTNPELEVVLKKTPSSFGDKKLKEVIKNETKDSKQLYYPLPSYNPNKFFKQIDWKECLDYWVSGGSNKDPRLIEAFKTCIIPLPDNEPIMFQPLNAHQIWVTNSGTGKSTFNLIYGNSPVQELTQAGLFGSNDSKYESQITGILQGKGMFMVDEVSELTVSNKDGTPLINLLLSYLEQGQVTRAFKKPVVCKGTKTIILNSNPKSKENQTDGILEFVNMVGSNDDKIRLGRRFGLLLFGNDFQTIDYSEPYPAKHINFIQRMVRTAIAKNQKPIYALFSKNYNCISQPDNEMKKELLEIANNIYIPEIRELLTGLSMATAKIKTSAFRSLLLDNLDLITLGKYKEVHKLWKSNKQEYISRIHAINLESFKDIEKITITDNEIEAIKTMNNMGMSQSEIGSKLNKSQQAISKVLKITKAQ